MFQTRKLLKERIKELEKQLRFEQHHTRLTALIEKANLPKCKSPACYSCKHIAYVLHPGNGGLYLIGCGKDLNCPDFQPRQETAERAETLKETLYSMAKYYFPNLEAFPADDCVHIPQPPCHSAQDGTNT